MKFTLCFVIFLYAQSTSCSRRMLKLKKLDRTRNLLPKRQPDEEEQKHDRHADDHEARPAEGIGIQIEGIEAAAQRPHILAVEQLVLEIFGPGDQLPLGLA